MSERLDVSRVRTWAAIEAIDNPLAADAFNRCADEIERLQAENDAFRAQFKDADEIAAELAHWDGTDATLPDGWTQKASPAATGDTTPPHTP